MPKKTPESFNYLSNDPEFVPDPEIEEFMEEEISHAPKDPDLLAQRLHNNTAASPQDARGDPRPHRMRSTLRSRRHRSRLFALRAQSRARAPAFPVFAVPQEGKSIFWAKLFCAVTEP